jgi:hypothetical protein
MAENTENPQQNLDLDTGDITEVEVTEEAPVQEDFVADGSEDTEQQEYSASVQKRINKLTHKLREAERQRDESITYAKGVIDENSQFKARIDQLDRGYVEEYGSRVEAEERQVEEEYRRAVEVSDTEATIAAQKKLTEIAVAKDKVRQAKIAQDQQEQYVQQTQQPQPQQPQPQQPDPMAQEWAARPENSWFGQDEAMTFATFGIHKKMVEAEGFNPRTTEYYNELDRRVRDTFPNKFDMEEVSIQNASNNEPNRRNVQTVAGNTRSSNTGRTTKVRLTSTQKALAEKLGVPLEVYAQNVAKLEKERRANS